MNRPLAHACFHYVEWRVNALVMMQVKSPAIADKLAKNLSARSPRAFTVRV